MLSSQERKEIADKRAEARRAREAAFAQPYPYNFLAEIFATFDDDGETEGYRAVPNYPCDIVGTIEYLLLMRSSDREREIIHYRYEKRMTWEEIGKIYGVTRERIRQLDLHTIRKFRCSGLRDWLEKGVSGKIDAAKRQAIDVRLENAIDEMKKISSALSEAAASGDGKVQFAGMASGKFDVYVDDLDLSVRSFNCLKRGGAETLSDVAEMAESGQLERLRNLGKKSYDEIMGVLRRHGYAHTANSDEKNEIVSQQQGE